MVRIEVKLLQNLDFVRISPEVANDALQVLAQATINHFPRNRSLRPRRFVGKLEKIDAVSQLSKNLSQAD